MTIFLCICTFLAITQTPVDPIDSRESAVRVTSWAAIVLGLATLAVITWWWAP